MRRVIIVWEFIINDIHQVRVRVVRGGVSSVRSLCGLQAKTTSMIQGTCACGYPAEAPTFVLLEDPTACKGASSNLQIARLKEARVDEPTLVLLEDPTVLEPGLQEAVAEAVAEPWRRPVWRVLARPCACGRHRHQTCARQAVDGTDFCQDCCPAYCRCSCTACEVTLCGVSPDVSPRTTSRAVNVSPRTACIAVCSAQSRTPLGVLTATR